MLRVILLVVVGAGCVSLCCFSSTPVSAQTNFNSESRGGEVPLRQTRAQIAALPPSQGNAPVARFAASNLNSQRPQNPPQYHSSFYRQASSQSDVYPYPATSTPRTGNASRANWALSRSNSRASLSNQLLAGANTATGNLNTRINSRAPVYNLNSQPAAIRNPGSVSGGANSRTPVVQQRASTIDRSRSTSFSSNQAQPTPAATQPTTAFRQSVYQQPTLGLGGSQSRIAQNCNCTPAYNTGANYNSTTAAYQTPSLDLNAGQGLAVPPLNIQVPGQAGGQACCQPNYQMQQNIGTPQYGAQGANWWTPFVSGSGVYSPIVKFRNMPAGTYLGQGIIGQPTAYVDGQPFRNLLRYVSP